MNLIDDLDKTDGFKLVTFDRISSSSYLTVKANRAIGDLKFYNNLLEVVLNNDTYVYDMDGAENNPQEIHFVRNMDELIDLENFVDTGTNH